MDADRFDSLTAALWGRRRCERRPLLGWLAGVGLGAALGAMPAGDGAGAAECAEDEYLCRWRAGGRGRRRCVPADQCCPNEVYCIHLGCIRQEECCPYTERECRKRVNGHTRKTCVPRDQCCPDQVRCPVVLDGCCTAIVEQCAEYDGCCDVGGANRFVCDGKWCCNEGDECVPGVGCRPRGDCPDPDRNVPCGGGCCETGAKCCQTPAGDFYCCPSNRTCCSTGGPQCCV